MKDEFIELYEKILDNQDWEIDDLDRLIELAKAEGFESGRLFQLHSSERDKNK